MSPESLEGDPGAFNWNRAFDAAKLAGVVLLGAVFLTEVIAPVATKLADEPATVIVEFVGTVCDEAAHATGGV
jgi:hypothetical protein